MSTSCVFFELKAAGTDLEIGVNIFCWVVDIWVTVLKQEVEGAWYLPILREKYSNSLKAVYATSLFQWLLGRSLLIKILWWKKSVSYFYLNLEKTQAPWCRYSFCVVPWAYSTAVCVCALGITGLYAIFVVETEFLGCYHVKYEF